MTRLKKSWLFVLAAILFLCIGFALLKPPGRGQQHELSVAYRGWGVNTVWPNKPAILLEVTNPTSASVTFSVVAVERQVQAGWTLDEPALMGAYLDPGKAFVLQIPVATSNASWRIRLHCQEHARGLSGVADRAKEKLEKITGKMVPPRYNGRIYSVTTEIRQQ